jgi:hypothetical protein
MMQLDFIVDIDENGVERIRQPNADRVKDVLDRIKDVPKSKAPPADVDSNP